MRGRRCGGGRLRLGAGGGLLAAGLACARLAAGPVAGARAAGSVDTQAAGAQDALADAADAADQPVAAGAASAPGGPSAAADAGGAADPRPQPLAARPAPGPVPPPGANRAPSTPDAAPASAVPPGQAAALRAWFARVGGPLPGEEFGALVVRAAMAQLGKPYFDAPWDGLEEALVYDLTSFQCVSLVESSLALARCAWQGRADADCFAAELLGVRYRAGQLDGYPSRLHYFEDWLEDNARRGHLRLLAAELGGVTAARPTFFMSAHPESYPALATPAVRAALQATEARLSAAPMALVPRPRLAHAMSRLRTGDVVAVTGRTPGLLVLHVGFVSRDAAGVAHLLHASSRQHLVTVSPGDVAAYVLERPYREGIMVGRPLPPPPATP